MRGSPVYHGWFVLAASADSEMLIQAAPEEVALPAVYDFQPTLDYEYTCCSQRA